jgi:peptidoglycan hydrolase-like protein with peptidoglycan-binding domain
MDVQTGLKKLGFYSGVVDGIVGPATRRAIEEFSKANSVGAGPDTKAGVTTEWRQSFDSAVKSA